MPLRAGRGGGVALVRRYVLDLMHDRSRMTIDPRIPTMPVGGNPRVLWVGVGGVAGAATPPSSSFSPLFVVKVTVTAHDVGTSGPVVDVDVDLRLDLVVHACGLATKPDARNRWVVGQRTYTNRKRKQKNNG